jgi:hypothetical protein
MANCVAKMNNTNRFSIDSVDIDTQGISTSSDSLIGVDKVVYVDEPSSNDSLLQIRQQLPPHRGLILLSIALHLSWSIWFTVYAIFQTIPDSFVCNSGPTACVSLRHAWLRFGGTFRQFPALTQVVVLSYFIVSFIKDIFELVSV